MWSSTTFAIASALCCLSAQGAGPAPAEGKLTGHVRFDGQPPEVKPLPITQDRAKGCCPDGIQVDPTDPRMVISKEGRIANVVVTIDVPGEKAEPPAQPIEVDQKLCRFVPHVRVVPAGAKVAFVNSDPVSHNVHTYTIKNDQMNRTVAPGSREEQVYAKGDKVSVKCDLHDWMSAWIYVTDTPYFAVTGEDGSFEIRGLKPGRYKVELWHEVFGREKTEVVIRDDGTSDPLEVKMAHRKKSSEKAEKRDKG